MINVNFYLQSLIEEKGTKICLSIWPVSNGTYSKNHLSIDKLYFDME